jgi:hypothetical protein
LLTESVAFRSIKLVDMVPDLIHEAYLVDEPDRVGEVLWGTRILKKFDDH